MEIQIQKDDTESEKSEYEFVNEQPETRKFGPATQRLRVFIQKNFLKHSLEELENQNYQEIPMGFFILM